MNTSQKQQSIAIRGFLNAHASHVTHIVVAHTSYRTYGLTDAQMQRSVENAKNDCRYFRNCFNKALYGPKARRKPLQYQPLLIATLEGSLTNTDRHLTLHYNFAIGNLPDGLSNAEYQSTFKECWTVHAKQSEDIWFDVVNGDVDKARAWLGYSLKEADGRGNTDVWDFANTQIPYTALNAG